MKISISLFLAVILTLGNICEAKKVLDHSDFDRWEKVTNYSISRNGGWETFAVNPQEGDGILYFNNTKKGTQIEIKRGYQPSFSADGRWGFALVKPYFHETRKGKIAKKKDFDLPQDSLAIIDLTTGKVEKIGNVVSYRVPKDGGAAVAWLSCDTAYVKPKELKEKKGGKPLIVKNLQTGIQRVVNKAKDYVFSKDGSYLAMTLTKSKGDTISTSGTAVLKMADNTFYLIDRDKAFYGKPVFDESGTRLAYVASTDSVETGTRKATVFIADLTRDNYDPEVLDIRPLGKGKELFVNQYSTPEFSHNGKRIVVGVAPAVAPDDTTLVDFENPSIDIWRWDAPFTPPQENHLVKQLREATFPVVTDFEKGTQVLITDNILCDYKVPDRWDGDWALVADNTKHGIEVQWDYQYPVELYVVNVTTGEKRPVATVPNESFMLSPAAKYVAWFADRTYHIYDISTGKTAKPGEKIEDPLWQEDQDVPLKEREPYGIMGWTEGDSRMLVYDRYDVISLDPRGEAEPVNLTAGEEENVTSESGT